MIKSLKDARITDGLPRVLAKQPWVIALSESHGRLHEKTLQYADGSQIYTALNTVREEILDILAVNWKIDWYDTSFTLEQKRRIITTSIETRRVMGTARAVKLQIAAVYPGSDVREWFEVGGDPYTFDVDLHAMTTIPELERFLNVVNMTKNKRSHLRQLRIVLEGDVDGPDLLDGRLDPDPLGIETHYLLTYHGYMPVPEEIDAEKVKLHTELRFFGDAITYDGTICYDGSAVYHQEKRYNLAFVNNEYVGGMEVENGIGEITVLTRTVEVHFHNGERKYNGLMQYNNIYKKEVIS